jgi:hypothetical protein
MPTPSAPEVFTVFVLRADETSKPWQVNGDDVYCATFAVVAARDEKDARELAASNAGDEGQEAWLSTDPSYMKAIEEWGTGSLRGFIANNA